MAVDTRSHGKGGATPGDGELVDDAPLLMEVASKLIGALPSAALNEIRRNCAWVCKDSNEIALYNRLVSEADEQHAAHRRRNEELLRLSAAQPGECALSDVIRRVRELVHEGADICYVRSPLEVNYAVPRPFICGTPTSLDAGEEEAEDEEDASSLLEQGPPLHTFIANGCTAAALACLETPYAVNFSTMHPLIQASPLHLLCENRNLSNEDAGSILRAIVRHVELHPQDIIFWGQRGGDKKKAFINLAAEFQRLTQFYRIVKHMPFFDDRDTPISLSLVWQWDWEALEEEERVQFTIAEPNGVIRASASTSRLMQMCYMGCLDATMIAACVAEGAELQFNDRLSAAPLHWILQNDQSADFKAIRACFATSQRIDFTKRDCSGNALLSKIFDLTRADNHVAAVLDLVIDRLEAHPEDTVDWSGPPTRYIDSFLALAARFSQLHVVWPVLLRRKVPYYMNHEGTFSVNGITPRDELKLGDNIKFFKKR